MDLLALDEKRVDNIVSVKVWSNVLDAPGRSLSMREILVFVSLGPLTHPKQQSPISATFYTEPQEWAQFRPNKLNVVFSKESELSIIKVLNLLDTSLV